jgi:thiosulfate/3-mercaptopyruvate sulfurtransferase
MAMGRHGTLLKEENMGLHHLMYRKFMVMLVFLLLAGCGSSVAEKVVVTTTTLPKLVAASTEFPNADLLVTPESVRENLGNSGLVIIDARGAGYDTAHVPGAISMKHADFWTAGVGLKETATLEDLLGKAGLTRTSRIVIYDNTTASWGAAGRIFWMLEYLGCTDVHIMNGGWDKWAADGRPTTAEKTTLPAKQFAAKVKSSARATSAHILNRYQHMDFAVIDARTDEEFIGWQLYGEARGGHIPGAVQIPYEWYYATDKTVLKYADLKTLLESRGITRDKEVTSYCTAGIRSGYVYFLLRLMGYTKASNYDASMFEWSADASLPMEKAQNYWRMVHAGWLKDLIDGKTPSIYSGKGYKIFECSWGSTSSAYDKGHIPGAVHFDTNNVEARNYLDINNPFPVSDANEIVWDLVADNMLQARLAGMGISNTTTVIVYGSSGSATTRVYWALRYAGVDVRYLNGGYDAWTANGGIAQVTRNQPVQAVFTINPQAKLKALTPEVKEYADYFRSNKTIIPGKILVDVRSKEEYAGEVVGYDDPNITRKGRIPGAVWAYNGGKPNYMDADGTIRSYTEVEKMWKDIGITADKTLIFYCGTGWRSTLAFFHADLMGFTNIKNYDSWYVWSTFWKASTGTIQRNAPYNDSSMPIDTGWPGP